jgi:uncharacterized protein YacL
MVYGLLTVDYLSPVSYLLFYYLIEGIMFVLIRVLFMVIWATIGALLAYEFSQPVTFISVLIGTIVGITIGGIIIFIERFIQNISLKGLSSAIFGLFFGLLLSMIVAFFVNISPLEPRFRLATILVSTTLLSYFGIILALRGKDEFSLIIPYVRLQKMGESEQVTLLDTSVIIDGRIADICQTNFIEGKLIIPRFVLKELQNVADSEDRLKRQRGRRGLDVLNRIRKSSKIEVVIHEDEIPGNGDVDTKLVSLAKLLHARVLTNDYNLNKVAEIQGVKVLNINELANALKTVVLPGEELNIKIIQEGKEEGQGVGYLDDGTMIIVEKGKSLIGQTCNVTVRTVLQTPAGKMVFAKTQTDDNKFSSRSRR